MAACTAAAANQRGCKGPSSAYQQWPDFLHWRLESELDIQGVQAYNHAWRCREMCSWNLEMASLRLQVKQNDYSVGAMLWIWGVQMRWKIRINNWFSLFSWVRLHPGVTIWIRPCAW